MPQRTRQIPIPALCAWLLEFAIWLSPVCLALLGHLYGWMKADVPPERFLFLDDRTLFAQRVWHFLASEPWIFVVHALILTGAFVLLRVRQTAWWSRLGFLVLLGSPGLWYFYLSTCLGGKFMAL
jgi:hypothetical protein